MSNEVDKLKAVFGTLSGEEVEELRKRLQEVEISAEDFALTDGLVTRNLLPASDEKREVEVPPFPPSVAARMNALKQRIHAEFDSTDTPPISPWRTGVLTWFQGPLGLAAAVALSACLIFWLSVPGSKNGLVAHSAQILTPGPLTGFTEPVISWKTDRDAPVTIELQNSRTGRTVALLQHAFSPVPFSDFKSASSAGLVPGEQYRVLIRAKSKGDPLTSKSFRILEGAEVGPTRAARLDEVVKQCEALITANRHADAWMIWGYLTEEEKRSPRMQSLKQVILKEIESESV